MENIRIIQFGTCKMVTSGIGLFGDPNFVQFEKFMKQAKNNTPYPHDFLSGADGKFEWYYLYEEGMDTMGLDVVDFDGGLYAVVCGIDAQSNKEEMAAVKKFLETSHFEQDNSRRFLGNVIPLSDKGKAALGYAQMDYYVPIKIKDEPSA